MKVYARAFLAAVLVIATFSASAAKSEQRHHVKALKITVLSTMLAEYGIGEWGYAALVEVDGKRMLFDTGARPQTVLINADDMGIDLSDIEDLIISHNHADHTGGLLTIRRELQKRNPRALSRAHVGKGIFRSRPGPNGRELNGLLPLKADYEASGGTFIVHDKPTELLPGVWLTGPVPRTHAEKYYPPGDPIPEDSSLVIATDEGLVVLTGCGHAGVINTTEYARQSVEATPLLALIGGLHTLNASDEELAWTAEKLKAMGLRHFLAGHCTGIEATFRIRRLAGLDRKTAVVSAVGSSFTLGKGIDPLALAH